MPSTFSSEIFLIASFTFEGRFLGFFFFFFFQLAYFESVVLIGIFCEEVLIQMMHLVVF